MVRRSCVVAILLVVLWPGIHIASGEAPAKTQSARSIADRSVKWPTWSQFRRVLLLEDYNTRVVVFGATLLGAAGGVVGSFTLLRKRALMGDALSHATLPGIGIAFIAATVWGGDGKSLLLLLAGATVTGLAGVGVIVFLRRMTRLKEDTALGIVLSVFFGAGAALLGVIQQMKGGHAAGLEGFIYGKTASMGAQDAQLIAAAALVCIVTCTLLFKELKLLCYDDAFAGSRGFPVAALDLALMAVVIIITIVGLQAVGLILMVALLVIPAAAARFWTEKMGWMVVVSAALGALGGSLGAGVSAVFSKVPSGAMIVLVYTGFFLVSLLVGFQRGVLIRWLRRLQLNRRVARQHFLRALYETLESSGAMQAVKRESQLIPIRDLLSHRSWTLRQLKREARSAHRDHLVKFDDDRLQLTQRGMQEASRLTRQHRLWELYLIAHADIAPGLVDRDADAIEHVLEPEIVAELEAMLADEGISELASPHALPTMQGAGG